MDLIPNEVIRICFEHVLPCQRLGLARVCFIWRYLVATFKDFPKYYTYNKTIRLDVCPQRIHFDSLNLVVTTENKKLIINQDGLILCTLKPQSYQLVIDKIPSLDDIVDEPKTRIEYYGFSGSLSTGLVKADILLKCGYIAVMKVDANRIRIFDGSMKFICKFYSSNLVSISDCCEDHLGNICYKFPIQTDSSL